MTLQNGCIYRGKAYLWTDTAVFDARTGAIIGHSEKAFRGINAIWAAVYSGTFATADPYRVQRMIGESWPTDSGELVEVCRQALIVQAADGLIGRILLAFPCAQSGARLMMIAADSERPFEPEEKEFYMSSGNGQPWAAGFADNEVSPHRVRRFIDRQIATPNQTTLGWTRHSIAGNVLEIEVSADGVNTNVVRTAKQVASLKAA